ncbi:MAG: DUF1080 domain-containing protein [Phycisphaeraceae bacterium]|nr:DUF1080 domain-containing protein [Phycisphaeraceae bacterium]
MNNPSLTSIVAAVLAIAGSITLPMSALAQGTGATKATQPITDRAAGGWTVLFDGSSTEHWRSYRKDSFPTKGWIIEDGTLKVTAGGGGGDIITKDQYGDFDLELEFKVAPGANSGIMYRVTEAFDWPWMTGPEYQILDDAKHNDGKNTMTSVGAVYALYAAKDDKKVNPPGEWNTARIRLEAGKLTHMLNGEVIVECRIDNDEWKQKIAASKFNSMPGFGIQPRGHISLQDHGDDVWFRNIRIRSLDGSPRAQTLSPSGRGEMLFNGKDLTGWSVFSSTDPGASPVWSVKDGVLICSGNPAGYIKTVESYEDFVLTLEWRWNPETKAAGNSGVLLRVNGEDKIWPRSVEAQLHSGNAGDFWNIGEMAMTVDPARANGRNTRKMAAAEKPVGEWNRYVISCIGDTITLKINGQLVNEATGVERVAGPIALQSEGTEIHFRNIAVVPVQAND